MPPSRSVSRKIQDKVDSMMSEEKLEDDQIVQRLNEITAEGNPKPGSLYVIRSRLRTYMKTRYEFLYPANREDTERYNEQLNQRLEERKELKTFPNQVLTYLKNLPNRFEPYVDGGRILRGRPNAEQRKFLRQLIYRITYLLYTTGRRIDEVVHGDWLKVGDKISYLPSKVIGETQRELFTPLISTKKVMGLYREMKPFLERQTTAVWTTRLHYYLEYDIKAHDLRRIYSRLCSEKDKRNVGELEKIKECLNHKNILSSARYNVRIKPDEYRCEVCDKTMKASSRRNHERSQRHLRNLQNQQ